MQVHFSPINFESVGEMDRGHADRNDSQTRGTWRFCLLGRKTQVLATAAAASLTVDACVNVCDLGDSI